MARDGAGNYSLPEAAFVYDTVISETAMNSNLSDIATALTGSIAKDGQTTPTANLPMGTYKFTGLGAGSAATDSANLGQVQAQAWSWCGTAGGTTNALTLSPSPAITAYAAGQSFRAIIGAANTDDAVTVAISGLPTKAVEIDGAACSATVYLETGKLYQFDYDGTAFQATRLAANLVGVLNADDIGVTVQAYDADTAKTDVAQDWTADQRLSDQTVTDGTIDIANGQIITYTPSGADTLEFANELKNQTAFIKLVNGSNYAITLGAEIKAPDGMATAISSTGTYIIGVVVMASGGGTDTVELSYVETV